MTSAGTPSRSVGPLTVRVWFASSKSRVASSVVTPGKPVGATGSTTGVAPADASARAAFASSYVISSIATSSGPRGADHLDRPRLGGLGAAHPAEQQEAHRTQQKSDPPQGVLPDS